MIDSFADFINTFVVVAFGVVGWIIKRIVQRLDIGDKRLTKIEVELAAQRKQFRNLGHWGTTYTHIKVVTISGG